MENTHLKPQISAVIFDLDGTLLNTGKHYFQPSWFFWFGIIWWFLCDQRTLRKISRRISWQNTGRFRTERRRRRDWVWLSKNPLLLLWVTMIFHWHPNNMSKRFCQCTMERESLHEIIFHFVISIFCWNGSPDLCKSYTVSGGCPVCWILIWKYVNEWFFHWLD